MSRLRWGRHCLRGKLLGNVLRFRRGLFRLGCNVRVLSALRALSGNARARQRAVKASKSWQRCCQHSRTGSCIIRKADTEQVAVSVLAVGDHVRVKPGGISADGEIVEGEPGGRVLLTGKVGQSTNRSVTT